MYIHYRQFLTGDFVFVAGAWALSSDISAGNAPPGFLTSGFALKDVFASDPLVLL